MALMESVMGFSISAIFRTVNSLMRWFIAKTIIINYVRHFQKDDFLDEQLFVLNLAISRADEGKMFG